MVTPAKREATYRDVLEAPPHLVAEILHGDLFLQPRPAAPHAEAASVLGMLLGNPYRLGRGGPGGWVLLDEPELHLGRHVLVPDLAGWRQADHPELDLTAAYFERAPTWVAEILSPSTRATDRVRKLPIYAEHGVEYAWLVDPIDRTLEVYRNASGQWTLLRAWCDDAEVEPEPFDAVPLPLGELWVTPQSR